MQILEKNQNKKMDSRLLANVNLLRLLVSFGKYLKNCALYKKSKYLYKTVNSTPEILTIYITTKNPNICKSYDLKY